MHTFLAAIELLVKNYSVQQLVRIRSDLLKQKPHLSKQGKYKIWLCYLDLIRVLIEIVELENANKETVP